MDCIDEYTTYGLLTYSYDNYFAFAVRPVYSQGFTVGDKLDFNIL